MTADNDDDKDDSQQNSGPRAGGNHGRFLKGAAETLITRKNLFSFSDDIQQKDNHCTKPVISRPRNDWLHAAAPSSQPRGGRKQACGMWRAAASRAASGGVCTNAQCWRQSAVRYTYVCGIQSARFRHSLEGTTRPKFLFCVLADFPHVRQGDSGRKTLRVGDDVSGLIGDQLEAVLNPGANG